MKWGRDRGGREESIRCQRPTPACWGVDVYSQLGPRDSNQLRVIKTEKHLTVAWGTIQKIMTLSKCIFSSNANIDLQIYCYSCEGESTTKGLDGK